MSKFFIGCPVKKVRGDRNVGNTGRVTAVGVENPTDASYNIQVRQDQDWKGATTGTMFPAGSISWSKAEEWEPIIPDGAQPSEWKNVIVWDPSLIKEKELCTALVIV